MLDLAHLGHQIGTFDKAWIGATSRENQLNALRLVVDQRKQVFHIQQFEPRRDIGFVKDDQLILAGSNDFANFTATFDREADILGLGLTPKPAAAAILSAYDPIPQELKRGNLAVTNGFDELGYENVASGTSRTYSKPYRCGRFALAVTGVYLHITPIEELPARLERIRTSFTNPVSHATSPRSTRR